jgi:SNF family Na+-dependent transporter
MKEKSFFSILLNLPRLIFMRETRGVALVAIKQLGLVTIIKILFKTVTKTGFIKSIKCVFSFKLNDLLAFKFILDKCQACLRLGYDFYCTSIGNGIVEKKHSCYIGRREEA